MSILERLKQNWFISVLMVCAAVAGVTWKVAQEVLVSPRDFQIAQLKDEVQRAKTALGSRSSSIPVEEASGLEKLSVFEGQSATTSDGRVTIRMDHVGETTVSFSAVIDANKPTSVKDQRVGDRAALDAGDRFFYVDVNRTRGNIADLSVSQKRKQ